MSKLTAPNLRVHAGDWLRRPVMLAGVGVSFVERLGEALSKQSAHCVIIASTDDVSCSVRFHRRRDDESWLADDLESYRDEGIAVLET